MVCGIFRRFMLLPVVVLAVSGCAEVSVPDARNVKIPSPVSAEERREAVNERPDSVMYLPLGEDVLVPEEMVGGVLPEEIVGPFELRSETLAGALQLILADYDIAIAFETEEGLTRRVTVANLRGQLHDVVNRVCGLADLYCSYENGALTVKDTQTFTVVLPPLGGADGETEFIDDVITGITAIVGEEVAAPIADPTTRTIIYSATQRTSALVDNYFQRLRANTAMIVFETYIWEVSLNSGNSTGIDWSKIDTFGKFNASIGVNGSIGADFTNPVSIGLPTTQSIGATPTDLIQFLSQFGALKTISQPQITVLSGASAELRVADTENFVSEISTTINDTSSTTAVTTGSVDSGFTLSVGSSWDKSTVYANVSVNLTNVNEIEDFTFSDGGAGGTSTTIQLPQTSERELTTQIRVRPGDSVLIAGLVRENDNFSSRGPGFMEPLIPDSRTAQTQNLELVILLRPRVIVYTAPDDSRYVDYMVKKNNRVTPAAAARVSPVQKDIVKDYEPPKPVYEPAVVTPVAPVEPQASVVTPTKKPEMKIEEPVIESDSDSADVIEATISSLKEEEQTRPDAVARDKAFVSRALDEYVKENSDKPLPPSSSELAPPQSATTISKPESSVSISPAQATSISKDIPLFSGSDEPSSSHNFQPVYSDPKPETPTPISPSFPSGYQSERTYIQ